MQLNVILSIDIGQVLTRAVLLEIKNGQKTVVHSAVGPTTSDYPHGNIRYGILDIIEKIEKQSGRKITDEDGKRIKGSEKNRGIDSMIVMISAAGKLKTVVVGITDVFSAGSALSAAEGSMAHVSERFSLNATAPDIIVRRLEELQPDMVIIAGGFESGNIRDVACIADIVSCGNNRREKALSVIYTGNSLARSEVQKILGAKSDFYSIDNVNPEAGRKTLAATREKINSIYIKNFEKGMPGFDELKTRFQYQDIARYACFEKYTAMLGESLGKNILVVNAGEINTSVYSFVRQDGRTRIHTSITANSAVPGLFDFRGETFPLSYKKDYKNFFYNRVIRQKSKGFSAKEKEIEKLIIKKILDYCVKEHLDYYGPYQVFSPGAATVADFGDTAINPPGKFVLDMAIVSGRVFGDLGTDMDIVSLFSDCLRREGLTKVCIDRNNMVPHIGALVALYGDIIMETVRDLNDDSVQIAGYTYFTDGKFREGKSALSVFIKHGDSESTHDIKWGEKQYFHIGGPGFFEINLFRSGFPVSRAEKAVVEIPPQGSVLFVDSRKKNG